MFAEILHANDGSEHAFHALAWFAGSRLLGVLYDWSALALGAVSVLLQGAALVVLWRVWQATPNR
jgi:hypothetical protein